LTDNENALQGKELLRKYLSGNNVDLAGIRKEFSAQIDKVLEAGLKPTHIDGHQHCHAYPATACLVTSLAKEYDIDAMRSVRPALADPSTIPPELHEEINLFRQISRHTEEIYRKETIRTTSGLWGLPQLNSLDTAILCDLLDVIPQGVWELMVHPGYPDPQGRHFESPQRQVELTALCSDEAKGVIRRRGIQLMTFGDLPCVS
jgi:predicted glycoside hydrolase/deacetylase ChbG (UPF0249 family)